MLPYVFLIGLVAGIFSLWYQVPLPCERPIEYAVGTFDNRFGISESDFLAEADRAEQIWEKALGRELFHFVPGASFKLNLLFDERQERTLEAGKLESSLDQTKNTQENLDQKQKKIFETYTKVSGEYGRELSVFKKHLDAYNTEVKQWNKKGGASPEAYKNLEAVARALKQEGQALEIKRLEVNRLVKDVNAFSAQKVAVIESYNNQVEAYVNRYGEPQEFDQGDYVGTEINIYQYDDEPHLRAVLVHEFGHALGLIHGSDPSSLMYHLMKDQNLNPVALSAEDVNLLLAQCHQTVWMVISERLGILKERIFHPSVVYK